MLACDALGAGKTPAGRWGPREGPALTRLVCTADRCPMRRQRPLAVLACAACCLAVGGCVNQRYIEDEDRFPGWKGVLPSQAHQQPAEGGQQPRTDTVGYGELGQARTGSCSGRCSRCSLRPAQARHCCRRRPLRGTRLLGNRILTGHKGTSVSAQAPKGTTVLLPAEAWAVPAGAVARRGAAAVLDPPRLPAEGLPERAGVRLHDKQGARAGHIKPAPY